MAGAASPMLPQSPYEMQDFPPSSPYGGQFNCIDYGPTPHFESHLVENRNPDDMNPQSYYVDTFIVPYSQPGNVLAYTKYKFDYVTKTRKVPIPDKEFNYELKMQNFHDTFLAEIISHDEFQTFLFEVSKRMRESSRLKRSGCMICLRVFYILMILVTIASLVIGIIICLAGIIPSGYIFYFIIIPGAIAGTFYLMSRYIEHRKRVELAYNNLVSIIHEMKHQFLDRGILVRPGNYAAFIQFVPIVNSN